MQLLPFVMLLSVNCFVAQSMSENTKRTKCLNPPSTAKKVEKYIKECQEDVKTKIVKEALEILHEQWQHETEHVDHASHDPTYEHYNSFRRKLDYHPMLVPHEERRIAGCLLHCVYAKNNAIDNLGWPTLDGLVHFYSEGVGEHGFFMATLRSADRCLKGATHKYNVNRMEQPEKGKSCDVAFDVFDCISDHITEYCLDLYKH